MTPESFSPNNVLPECLATVSFDINLGKKLSSIDFDYAGYATYLREKGLSDDQISNLTIDVVSKTTLGIALSKHGSYSPTTDHIHIGSSSLRSEYMTNSALRHESEHKVDWDLDRVDDTDIRLLRVSNFTLRCFMLAGGITIGLGISSLVDANSLLFDVDRVFADFTLGCYAIHNLSYRVFSSLERRGRKAGRQKEYNFFSITPR